VARVGRAAAAASQLDVEFVGWQSAPFSQFHRGDILVLPSHWEGLPYLLQEALDHGVPAIASDVAGNRTALGDGEFGHLYRLGDDGALTAALAEALANLDALRAKAEKGRAALRPRYGAAAFWRALSAELDQVGERRHA
jgi:GalNAc-alpha-(1->4)-GalNAc-alpha-(1->3)-diNAcBac-PP-undecaprenol alpha-1,4-N-acetyl-D-galactosaminyltransferase